MAYTTTTSACIRTADSRNVVNEAGAFDNNMSGMEVIVVTRGDSLSFAVKESR